MSQPLSDTTLSTFTASDGDNLALQDWPLPDGVALRGVVLLVHGLGEHAGRYDHVARRLNSWGFAVRGYDQYGHGESDGVRGALPLTTRLLDDLIDVIDSTRARMDAGVPMILLGHSMGGLVSACLLALRESPVEGLVLSSPVLDAGLNPFQKLLLATLPRIAPNLTVGNGVDPDFISHDPDVVAAYKADPKVHDRVSGRLARFIAEAGPMVIERAPQWAVPTLLLYAGADKVVNPRGSRAFAAAAPAQVVTVRCFDGLFHEILNELDSEPVFEAIKQWLDERFPA
ncbi:MAG: acylglycerol lipase-like protein [Ramlibacter sp.]|nr:acylglycerol lipase-like protein [Ramlibacter sp.]